MSIFSIIAMALSFAIALLCSWALLIPFFSSNEHPERETSEDMRRELLAKEESILQALEDVEQDYSLGKLTETDYNASRAELTEDAGSVLTQLDELEGNAAETATPTRPKSARVR